MITIEILYLVVGIVASIVGVICWHLVDLDKQFNGLKNHMLMHDKCFTDIEWHRVDDLGKLAALEQRVRILENKIDSHLIGSEAQKFPDPEDEGIII